MLSIGELFGAVLVSILLRWVHTKCLMLSSLVLTVSGGVLYSVGGYGWMVFIGMCNVYFIVVKPCYGVKDFTSRL